MLSGLRAWAASPAARRTARIAISVGVLAFLFVGMDWTAVPAHAARITPGSAAFVMVAFAVQLALSSWKWQWALRVHGLHFQYVFLTRVLVVGFFLNNFLPTSIGGDAYRIYRTLPDSPPRSRAISAVLLERLVGLSALLLPGLAGAIVLYSSSKLARAYVMLAALGVAAVVGICALIATRPPAPRNTTDVPSRWLTPIKENLRSITQARTEWLPLIGISLLFQAQAILIVYALFNAIDAHVSLPQAALIAATAGVATVVPLSINGLGIVEATIAGTAVAVGVPFEAGLLVALLMRILIIPLTLLAGLLCAFEPVRVRDLSTSRAIADISGDPDAHNIDPACPGRRTHI